MDVRILAFFVGVAIFAIAAGSKFYRKQYVGGALYLLLPPIIAIIAFCGMALFMDTVSFEAFWAGFKPLGFIAMAVAALVGLVQLLIRSPKISEVKLDGVGLARFVLAAALGVFIFHFAGHKFFKENIIKDTSRNISGDDAEFQLTSIALTKEYEEKGEETTNTKYLDEVISVTGVAILLEDEFEGITKLYLTGHSELGNVFCKFNEKYMESDEYKSKMGGISNGDQVKVKGWCNGPNGFDVALRDCVFE